MQTSIQWPTIRLGNQIFTLRWTAEARDRLMAAGYTSRTDRNGVVEYLAPELAAAALSMPPIELANLIESDEQVSALCQAVTKMLQVAKQLESTRIEVPFQMNTTGGN